MREYNKNIESDMLDFEKITKEELRDAGIPDEPLDFEEGFQTEIRKRRGERAKKEGVLKIRSDQSIPERGDGREEPSQNVSSYILEVLDKAGIEADDWFVKHNIEEIHSVPLFVRMVRKIKERGVDGMDSGDIMNCYRAVEKSGEAILEGILAGREKLEILLGSPHIQEVIQERFAGPMSLTIYLSGDPYLCEVLINMDMRQAELSAEILQKIGKIRKYERHDMINLDSFVYFTQLVSRYEEDVRGLEWNDDFLEKNHLSYRGPFEILLYRLKGTPLPLSQEEDRNWIISGQLAQEYFREMYPFINELEDTFSLSGGVIPVGANNDFSGTCRNIATLRFLYENPDFQEVIADTFSIKNLSELVKFTNLILEQRSNDPIFSERVEAVLLLHRAVRGSEFRGIEDVDLLYGGFHNERDPAFVKWLAVLYKETGINVVDELGEQNSEGKILSWRKWYENPDDFRLAVSMGIFEDNDQLGENSSKILYYGNFSDIVKDKNLLGFLQENEDMNLFGRCLEDGALLEGVKKWERDREIFNMARSQGFFLAENQIPMMAHNLQRYETIAFLLRSNDFLIFMREYPDTSLQKEFLMRDCEKNTGSECASLRSWIEDQSTFGKVRLLGVSEYTLERSLLEYSRFACLGDIDSDKVAGMARFLHGADWKKERWILDNLERFSGIEDDQKELYLSILEQVEASSSKEIQRVKNELIPQILQSEDPEESYRRIKDIFIRNNLPLVGKVFRIFQTLHPAERFRIKLENNRLSPCLREAGSRRRYKIVYEDLLKVHIESGNRNLQEYLEVIANGEKLLYRFEQGEELSVKEQGMLNNFFAQLRTLFLASQLSKREESPSGLTDGGNQYDSLRRNLQVQEGQKISERLSEMFLEPLGYTSFEEVLRHMQEKKREAHKRRLALYQEIRESELVLQEGNFIKGVDSLYIDNILQNGSVAKEYLGEDSSSDVTPFDTDLAKVMQSGSVREVLSQSMAVNYGSILFLLKDRGQFQKTTEGDSKRYDSEKLEIFQTTNEQHWGIRTGFPSTEIDCMIVKDSFSQDAKRMNALFIDIAQNGNYIPVVGENGKILLSPEEFDKYREGIFDIDSIDFDLVRLKLAKVMEDRNHTPKDVMDIFGLGPMWHSDVGVAEGYTLGQHTEMIMKQFWKYFRESFPEEEGVSMELMEISLALHDIGKPHAVLTGDKGRQHRYTKYILRSLLPKMGYPVVQADMVVALIDGDPIGEYLQGESVKNACTKIRSMAEMSGLSLNYFLKILEIFYKADAGSYTVDAGGKASLDNLFVFQPETGSMHFAPQYEDKMEILRREVRASS